MLAINALYRLPRGELLLQDAPELIEKVSNCMLVQYSMSNQLMYACVPDCQQHSLTRRMHGMHNLMLSNPLYGLRPLLSPEAPWLT